MTVVVGIICDDGVVVGADSSATFTAGEFRTIEQPTKKVFVIRNEIILAGTGAAGLIQRFENPVAGLAATPNFLKNGRFKITQQIAQAVINDFGTTQAPQRQLGAVLAFASIEGLQLCEFSVQDLQPEFKTPENWFVSLGSGQPITDPFLGMLRRVFFAKSRPKLSEAIFAVTWALQQAIELNPGGINAPMQVGVVAKDTKTPRAIARILTDDELSEHANNVRGVEEYLARYRQIIAQPAKQDIPQP